MSDVPESSGYSSSAPVLPPKFLSIREIQDFPSEKVAKNPMVNVIGFISDFQAPMETRGSDFKCTLEIKDISIQYETYGVKVVIFWPMSKMPRDVATRDAVILRRIKCQMFGGKMQFLVNKASEIYILPNSQIPRSVTDCQNTRWKSYHRPDQKPSLDEIVFVVESNLVLHENALPSTQQFQEKTNQSMNIKDKFGLLKDVEQSKYYDLIVQVIRKYDAADPVTLYVTDFTANSGFYDHVWGGAKHLGDRDSDENGYKDGNSEKSKEWPGPYGKMSIQLNLFDDHGLYVRTFVNSGDWILLKNVHIKTPKNGGCLEGYMHHDRTPNIDVLEQRDSNDIDPRWKEAVRRKSEYWEKFKKQKEAWLQETAAAGEKRKPSEDPTKEGKLNSKKRRKERRAAALNNAEVIETKSLEHLNLNTNIKCNYPDMPTLKLEHILKPQKHSLAPGQDIILPFVNEKYRANVRVVGYFPHKVEDFAVGRRVTEYDILSDYSGGDDTDREEDIHAFEEGKRLSKKVWEWRFALEVEDAGAQLPKERTWLVVDNRNAQGLLNMDAVNLRASKSALLELKEKLCILWGELEEQKSALLRQKSSSDEKALPSSSEEPSSSPFAPAGNQPDLDSDGENDASEMPTNEKSSRRADRTEQSSKASLTINRASALVDPYHPVVRNKAFTCCIKQYGVKVYEKDQSKANAGNGKDGIGKKWARTFGLFGVNIV